ncbi:MAG: AI-2E family transporter [Actinomycetota bacterium]
MDDDATEEHQSEGWWKPIAVALAALAGAFVAWGWFKPRSEPTELADIEPGGTEDVAVEAVAAPVAASSQPVSTDRRAPEWVRPTIVWTIGVVVAVGVGLALLGVLQTIVFYIVLALFFSFAMEPAVNWLHDKRGWRRGSATGLLLFLVFLLLVVLVLIFVPTLLKGAAAIADRLPEAAQRFETWASNTLGIDVSTSSIQSGSAEASSSLAASSETPMSMLLGFTASLVGGIFAAFTVGMFIFYMVAEAPKFKRSVLSFFPRQKQEELLSIWEAAIEKTGGYFYGKLLLAIINGGLFWIVLLIVGVPGAAALALFQGVVAEFIPIVGTYIAAIVPLVVALVTVGTSGTIVLLIWVLIYQQIENYLLSPKIQGKTMQLHPAVAFGAAMAGGAIGGLLWAFLALPFAATVQAAASLWIQRHEVIESEMTHLDQPVVKEKKVRDEDALLERGRRALRSSRGWIRKRLRRDEPEVDVAHAEQIAGAAPEPGPAGPVDSA